MDLRGILKQLKHSHSTKRRSAARKLRKIGNPVVGPELLEALEQEVKDTRTWETQYQMVMALGFCGVKDAIPFLETLRDSNQYYGMVGIALGDSLFRLRQSNQQDVDFLLASIASDQNTSVILGGCQALAMLRSRPKNDDIERLIKYGATYEHQEDYWPIIWLLRATPGWPKELVEPLIKKWEVVPFMEDQQLFNAVELTKEQKYQKWSIL